MKKLLLILITAILFIGCKKTDEQSTSKSVIPASTFKYKINGMPVEMNGTLAENAQVGSVIRKQKGRHSSSTTAFEYNLMATKDYIYTGDGETPMNFLLAANSLSTGTYSLSNGKLAYVYFINLETNQHFWATPSQNNENSTFTVVITKVENGYADGTFSGIMRKNPVSFQITEGEFKNVKVLQ
jgi:hypothetical protein